MTSKTDARQNVVAAVQTFLLADLASGVAVDLFTKLPNGTIPLKIEVLIVTPFNAGTSDVIDIGLKGGSANAYANDLDLKSAAGTHLQATTIPGLVNSTDGGAQLQVTRVASGTAATAGEIRVIMTYVRDGQSDFSEG